MADAEDGGMALATTTQGSGQTSMPFRFQDLFPELRNTIYRLVLVVSTPGNSLIIDERASPQPAEPGLLMVSRQIRHETASIWYRENRSSLIAWDCDDSIVSRLDQRTDPGHKWNVSDVTWRGEFEWTHLLASTERRFSDKGAPLPLNKQIVETHEGFEGSHDGAPVSLNNYFVGIRGRCFDVEEAFMILYALFMANEGRESAWDWGQTARSLMRMGSFGRKRGVMWLWRTSA